MSDLQDAIDTVEQMDLFYSSVALNRVVSAARLVANPNIEAAAKARYEMERDHVSNDWPSWADLGDFGRRTQVEFIKPSVAAALTPGDPE
jgi:hypothetical protein